MYVTVWTSSGAIKVALPNNALIADLKQVLIENLQYVPEKLEISYGGRFVRDDVLVGRFPPETLVAEGPRFDPRRMQQQLQRQRQLEALQKQQREEEEERLRQQKEAQRQREALRRQQEQMELERRARLRQQQQQQFADPLSALFGIPSPARNRTEHSPSQHPRQQPQQRHNESSEDEDEPEYTAAGPNQHGGAGFNDLFGGLFGAPRPRSRATQQQEQHRAQQARRRAQHAEEQRRQQQHSREEALRRMEEQRNRLRAQQEEMRKQQEAMAREERELLEKMEEEARQLREKEALEMKKRLAKQKARAAKKAAKKASEGSATSDDRAAKKSPIPSDSMPSNLSDSEEAASDNAYPLRGDDEDDWSRPMAREESAVIVTPHLKRVNLDETLHRPQEEQPSPATSPSSTPRQALNESPEGDNDNAHASPTSHPTPSPNTVTTVTIKAHFPELEGKAIEVSVPADALVSDVIDRLKALEPEVTKQGVRIMFFEKYVKKVDDSIRAVPLSNGSTIDVCTGKYLSENEMTLYLAERHLSMVKQAIEAHEGPVERTLRGHWNEQLMKALMLLDSLQEVPEDIRLRRKALVKLVIQQQDSLADL